MTSYEINDLTSLKILKQGVKLESRIGTSSSAGSYQQLFSRQLNEPQSKN